VIDAIRRVLDNDPRVGYALLFGSTAREASHVHSDIDIAIGCTRPGACDVLAIGGLTAQLEAATGRPVHVVLLDEAPPGLAYRIFRDGRPLTIRDARAFRARLARAVLEYLDFKPIEDLFTQGVLRAGYGR